MENENIKWVDFYDQAPENARFILRRQELDKWILQEYKNGTQFNLKEFPDHCNNGHEFDFILAVCLKIIGDNSTLWVEKPAWMYTDEEFASFLKNFEDIYE